MRPDEPTDEMPGGPEGPTEANPVGDEPTGRIPAGNEDPTEAMSGGPSRPAGAVPPAGGGGKGIGVLVVAIAASLLLVGAYVAAGGPVEPDKAADPCDPRAWTDPQNLEEAAQQFALSAADGAACELGVSREELTRSIAEDQARQDFMDEHGFTESDLENALRASLNRAVDDAENAGAIGGLAATGLRAAIRVMPMSVMIGLLEDADSVFSGDPGALGGIGDAIDAITEGADSLGSGDGEDPLRDLGSALEGVLPEGTTDSLQEQIPDDLRQRLEEEARKRLERGVDGLLNP